ncbi:MAG TPA: MBL fold metallo-hydrolase [Kofleriaceae bacterium]|nr:MBL fold metallo-hydrolase [Kofleriaceae bacterium]
MQPNPARHGTRWRAPKYRSLILHWLAQAFKRPARAGHAVAALPAPGGGDVAITFGGHATVLCRFAAGAVACDPMLGNWAGPARREVAPGLTSEALASARVILISSPRAGHLHRKTLAAICAHNHGDVTVALPAGAASQISGLGIKRVVELLPGAGFAIGGLDITAVAAQPGLAFVIRGDGPSVLFCGRSGYFSGFAEIGETFAPDIALLPIGGFSPPSFRRRHMSPADALRAFSEVRARMMIPIRHGTFALSYERIEAPAAWLADLVATRDLDTRVAMLGCGETRVFSLPGVAEAPGDVVAEAPSDVVAEAPSDVEVSFDEPDAEVAATIDKNSDPPAADDEDTRARPAVHRAATGSDIATAARAAAERGSTHH